MSCPKISKSSNILRPPFCIKIMKKINLVLAGLVLGAVGSAQAELIDRGGGLLYDTTQNVTWLKNVSYSTIDLTAPRVDEVLTFMFGTSDPGLSDAVFGKNSGSGEFTGTMTWFGALAWADTLAYFDSVRGVTYSDWRLPSAPPLFSDEDIKLIDAAGALKATYKLTGGVGPVSGVSFWSDKLEYTYSPLTDSISYTIGGSVGGMDNLYQSYVLAWAVRDGDVAAFAVPEPTSLLLCALGFASLTGLRRKV